jgi:hypothetical protein
MSRSMLEDDSSLEIMMETLISLAASITDADARAKTFKYLKM